jgi:hypothetical protein
MHLSVARGQPPSSAPDPSFFRLGEVFSEQSMATAGDLCSQRVPASRADWTETLRQWRETHREKLDALKEASKALDAALRTRPAQGAPLDLGQYAMLAAQGPQLIMYGLAAANDAHAYELCEKLRQRMLDREQVEKSLDQAQLVISAALKAVSQQ